MTTATATCERCGKPATHHEVEIIGRDKVPHHLCDEHSREREGVVTPSKELRYGGQPVTFTEVLRRVVARIANETEFPAEMIFPAGMVPLPDGVCGVCGGTPADRQLTITRDGEIVGDVVFCVNHTPRKPTRPGRKDWLMSRTPVRCEHCDQPARVHVTIPTSGGCVTQHYCKEHARDIR